MRNFKLLLQREPAAVGSLVASIMPVLVLLGVVRIDEAGIAAVVVAVNTVVGFGVRLAVSPTAGADESRAGAEMSAPMAAG
jgi:mRNA-degrading endonuclease toxin of MazEF toxin-antitoxin module